MVPAIAVKTMNPPKNGFKKHLLANPFLVDVCSEIIIWGVSGACQTCFSMERKERNFAFKHYEVLNKMSCVAGLEDLRTDKPQSIETLLKNMARELFLESGPNI